MTVGIYSITHKASGKRYIGKSVNVEGRLATHKSALTQPVFDKKKCNRHLYNAVQRYGWDAFVTEIVEQFDHIDEELISARELHWMDHFQTCDRDHGYNLRRDSSTKMIVHEETRALHSITNTGEGNPNFGNHWSDEQKATMSLDAQLRHALGDTYGDEWRAKQAESTRRRWANATDEERAALCEKVSRGKMKYDFQQFDRTGKVLLRTWSSVKEIISENPTWKWQNIYNVCHGHKPSYMGFVWKQIPKSTESEDLMGGIAA